MAYRFWRSKKSFSIINIISGISFWGIAVGTAALIIVLSAFNGLESLVSSMFNSFHSEYRIEPVSGKYFENKSVDTSLLASIDGVSQVGFVVEDVCMVRYGERQQVVYLKGVEPGKGYEEKFTPLMLGGSSELGNDTLYQALVGASVYYSLGINPNDFTTLLTFYSPKRTAAASADISSEFMTGKAFPGGVFSVQQEFDESYIVVPVALTRDLFEYKNISTAIEISTTGNGSQSDIEESLQQTVGDKFVVKNRMEQEEAMYKIMQSEKLIVFLILAMILLITSFTIISTLTLEILSKQKDLSTLYALGADVRQVRRVIVSHGFIICLAGMLVGFVISIIILVLQQQVGLVRFEGGSTFITEIYPVKMIWTDFAFVFATILAIAFFVSRIPVRRIHSGWFSFRF